MSILQHVLKNDPQIRDEILERSQEGAYSSAESVLGDSPRLKATIQSVESGSETGLMGAEEAVVLFEARPSLLIREDAFDPPPSPIWRDRLSAAETSLRRAILATGRIELINHPYNAFSPFFGTGWLIAEDVIVTNQHVAKIFTVHNGDRFVFDVNANTGKQTEVKIDFKEEFGGVTDKEVMVLDVLDVEAVPGADMAFFRVRKASGLPPPLELGDVDEGAFIATIGYPGRDPRASAAQLQPIFDNKYAVKRLAPGMLMPGRSGFLLPHDCSTLKGSSGSCVIDLETGKAVGLHFRGTFGERNDAVTSAELKRKMIELGIQPPVIPVHNPIEIPEESPQEATGDRQGYDPEFLGNAPAVPLPVSKNNNDNGATLKYEHFSVIMHKSRKLAICAACNVDGNELRRVPRDNNFLLDGRIGADEQHGNELYFRNDYDRGHLVRRLDPVWGDFDTAKRANHDTFFFTNIAPQHRNLNQKFWNDLEDFILDKADAKNLKVSVLTGCVFGKADPKHRGVQIPRQFWKIVAYQDAASGKLRASGYMMDQSHLIVDVHQEATFGAFKTFQMSIARIAANANLKMDELVTADVVGSNESFALTPITRLADIRF